LWERLVLLIIGVLNIIQEPYWLSATILVVSVAIYVAIYARRHFKI